MLYMCDEIIPHMSGNFSASFCSSLLLPPYLAVKKGGERVKMF